MGQPQFHEVCPAFIGNTIDIIFVIKLSEGLDEDPVANIYNESGDCYSKSYHHAHSIMNRF